MLYKEYRWYSRKEYINSAQHHADITMEDAAQTWDNWHDGVSARLQLAVLVDDADNDLVAFLGPVTNSPSKSVSGSWCHSAKKLVAVTNGPYKGKRGHAWPIDGNTWHLQPIDWWTGAKQIPRGNLMEVPQHWLMDTKTYKLEQIKMMLEFEAPDVGKRIPRIGRFTDVHNPPSEEETVAFWGTKCFQTMTEKLRAKVNRGGKLKSTWQFTNGQPWKQGIVWSDADKNNQAREIGNGDSPEYGLWWPVIFVISDSGPVAYCQDQALNDSTAWPTNISRLREVKQKLWVGEGRRLDEGPEPKTPPTPEYVPLPSFIANQL